MKKYSATIQNIPDNAVRLFTDGSCYPNPNGDGGWAYILVTPNGVTLNMGSGYTPRTTNNRMELMAVIEGLRMLNGRHIVELVTDSEYVGKGIALWLTGWKRSGWRQKNADLWRELDELVNAHEVYVTCIRGHNGQTENEMC